MERGHYKLDVWKKSVDLVVNVYKLTATFPETEKFGLMTQIRRAAVSIPSNIAEGAARDTKKEFNNFLSIAQGSASELETHIIISERLGFINKQSAGILMKEIEDITRMISGLKKQLCMRNE